MTIISKAALAVELKITKSRVSQYVKGGLPVRSDGKLNREEAMNWIASKHSKLGQTRAPGVTRAAAIDRGEPPTSSPPAPPPPPHAMTAVAKLIGHSGAIVREAGFALGLPAKTVWMLEQIIAPSLAEAGEKNVPARWYQLEKVVDEGFRVEAAKWERIAADRGEPFDEDAWWRELDEVRDA